MTQKFFKGDLVHIGQLPVYMRHFTQNCDAIVIATYAEQYGGSGKAHEQYTLYLLQNKSESSWYLEDQLTFKEADRFDLLPKSNIHRQVWEAKQERDRNETNQ